MSAALALASAPSAAPAAGALDLVVRRIHHGSVRTGTVRTNLPAALTGQTWWQPGPVRQHTAAAVDAVAEVCTRCAPWLRCYIGPALWCMVPDGRSLAEYRAVHLLPNGRWAARIAGQAWRSADIILVSTAHQSMPEVLDTAHHEIWHAVENWLSSVARAVVDAAVADGRAYPSAYLDSAGERRARLYAAWASAVDEGLPLVADPRTGLPLGELEHVLHYVYAGRLAAAMVAADAAARAAERSAAVRRAGLRSGPSTRSPPEGGARRLSGGRSKLC